MPPQGIKLLPRSEILRYEEIQTIARAAVELGITKVRLTGGEPLIRSELTHLIRMLSEMEGIEDISLPQMGCS